MQKRFASLSVFLMLLFFLTACGGSPEPGSWVVPDEYDDNYEKYGAHWIFFGVSQDSTTISSFDFNIPYQWQCDQLTLNYDQIFVAADENDPYEVSTILPTYVTGTLSAITDGSFGFTLDVFVYEGSIFDLQAGTFAFSGKFTSPKKASGTWELDLPGSGNNCSGAWYAMPNPASDH